MRGLVSIIFLIHLVITQGDNSDKTRKFDQIKCRLKLKVQERLQCKRVSYRPPNPTLNGNERLCFQLQIDQMSIKIESSRNITYMSAIDPQVRLQIATSVCASDFELIKCRLK